MQTSAQQQNASGQMDKRWRPKRASVRTSGSGAHDAASVEAGGHAWCMASPSTARAVVDWSRRPRHGRQRCGRPRHQRRPQRWQPEHGRPYHVAVQIHNLFRTCLLNKRLFWDKQTTGCFEQQKQPEAKQPKILLFRSQKITGFPEPQITIRWSKIIIDK